MGKSGGLEELRRAAAGVAAWFSVLPAPLSKGQLLNVNADTLASHLAARLKARRLVIAGGTAGVLDADGRTIARLTSRDAAQLVKAGTANKGMVAKLQACRDALKQGVGDVLVANGRRLEFDTLANGKVMQPDCTQVVR